MSNLFCQPVQINDFCGRQSVGVSDPARCLLRSGWPFVLSVNGIFWCLISTGGFFFFWDGWRGVQQMFRSSLRIIKSGPTATEGPPIKTPSGPRWPPDYQTSTRPLSHPLAHTTKQPITFGFSFALTKQNLCREMLPDLWLARGGILWGTAADGGVGMWINRLAGRLTDGIYGGSRRQRINFFEGNTPQPGSFVLAGNLALSSSPGAQLTSDSGNVGSRERLGWELHCVIATDVCGSDERWGFLLFVFKGWAWVLRGGTKRQEVALLYRLCRTATQGTCITLQSSFFFPGKTICIIKFCSHQFSFQEQIHFCLWCFRSWFKK